MPLSIDTGRAIRLPSELNQLVDAVLRAGDHDETDWIEWKSRRDLLRAEDVGDIARHVLAFSNRDPDRAHGTAEGYGYLVVGAQPGEVHGVEPIDPAALEAKLRPYLGGADGPGWWHHYVETAGKTVLVISVAPPKWGDPIRLLRKPLGSYLKGTVFVRRNGATEIADDTEMDMLQRRIQRGRERINASVIWSSRSPTIPPIDLSEDVVGEWIEAERGTFPQAVVENSEGKETSSEDASQGPARSGRKLILSSGGKGPTINDLIGLERRKEAGEALSEEEERLLNETHAQLRETMKPFTEALSKSFGFLGQRTEDRTPEAYEEEIGHYLQDCERRLPAVLVRSLVASSRAALRLVLVNNPDVNLPSVEVEALVEGPVMALSGHEEELDEDLPRRPRHWGTPRPHPLLSTFGSRPRVWIPPATRLMPEVTIDNTASARVIFRPLDLRPEARVELPVVHLVVAKELAGETLTLQWKATSTGASGVASGTLTLPIASSPLVPLDLVPTGGPAEATDGEPTS